MTAGGRCSAIKARTAAVVPTRKRFRVYSYDGLVPTPLGSRGEQGAGVDGTDGVDHDTVSSSMSRRASRSWLLSCAQTPLSSIVHSPTSVRTASPTCRDGRRATVRTAPYPGAG